MSPTLVILLLSLAVSYLSCVSATCVDTCVLPESVNNTPEFRAARYKLAKCLFDKTDSNGDGKITEKEYDTMIDSVLGRWNPIRNTVALWSVAKSVCNCNCNDDPKVTIDWGDIEGTEPKCLSTTLIIKQASSTLGCQVKPKNPADASLMSRNAVLLEAIALRAESLLADRSIPVGLLPEDEIASLVETAKQYSQLASKQTRSKPFRFTFEELETLVNSLLKRFADLAKARGAKEPHEAIERFAVFVEQTLEQRRAQKESCARPATVTQDSFESLAGLTAEKAEITRSFIKPSTLPGLYGRSNRKPGVLFYGLPGVGKTAIARAACNELNKAEKGRRVAFFPLSGADVKSRWHGETEKQVRDAFACAQDIVEERPDDIGNSYVPYSMAVVFFDEAEDLVSTRTSEDPAARLTTNAIIKEMDGFASSPFVSVMAATNFPWQLDKAFLRRIPSKVFVDLQDRLSRLGLVCQCIVDAYLPHDYIIADRKLKWAIPPKVTYHVVEVKHAGAALDSTLQKIKRAGGVGKDGNRHKPLSFEDIRDVVVPMFGPSRAAEKIMAHRPKEEFSDKALYKLGYTTSDILNVMNIAVANAADRALDDGASFVRNEGQMELCFEPKPGQQTFELDEAIEQVGEENVVNYVITLEDIRAAAASYNSSVDERDYQKLVDWKNGKTTSTTP